MFLNVENHKKWRSNTSRCFSIYNKFVRNQKATEIKHCPVNLYRSYSIFFTRSITHRSLTLYSFSFPSFTKGTLMENLGNLGSPMDHDQVPLLQQYADTPGIKRTRNFLSPPTQPLQGIQHSQQQLRLLMTHPSEKKKINFPPTVVSFNGSHQCSIRIFTISSCLHRWLINVRSASRSNQMADRT